MLTAPVAVGNPFSILVGTWAGKGTARLDSGKRERISCRGYYSGKGAKILRLNIICANPSTKVELRSVLNNSNGRVSGTWEERNFNQSGTISGSVTDSEMNLSIDGGGLNGSLKMTFGESSQSVIISTNGSALRGMNIELARTS
jgi:hypothetical protein